MIGTIGLLIKNAPAIVKGVVTLTPFLPKRWSGALNKVRTGAVVAGAAVAGGAALDVGDALYQLSVVAFVALGASGDVAIPAASIASKVLMFAGVTAATFVTGWATGENPQRLDEVDRF